MMSARLSSIAIGVRDGAASYLTIGNMATARWRVTLAKWNPAGSAHHRGSFVETAHLTKGISSLPTVAEPSLQCPP